MAINLKDLIDAQLELEKKAPVESMSIAEFRKMKDEARETAKAQLDALTDIDSNVKKDSVIKLSRQIEEAKTDAVAKEISEATVDALTKIDKTLNKKLSTGTGDSKGLATNVDKLLKEISKSSKIKLSTESAARVTDKSMNLPQFKTIGERVTEKKEAVKNLFSARGMANALGIVKRGSGGVVDTMLARREAKWQYIEDRKKTDPHNIMFQKIKDPKEKAKAEVAFYSKQFDKQQVLAPEMRKNEKEIARLKAAGYDDAAIDRTGLSKRKIELAQGMAALDPRVREKTETAKKETPAKATTKKVVTAEKIMDAGAFSDESQVEAQRLQESTVNLLTKIEENTRVGKEASTKPEKEDAKGRGILDNIMGFLGDGFMKAIKAIFSPKNLLKAFTKVFVPAMIISSLINGIMDGFKKFTETGSISEALIAGLGGILDFLTFGLFDAEKLKSVVDFVGKAIDGFIDPIKNFFTSMIDGITGMISNFTIPKISLGTYPVVGEVAFGPFQPFKKDAKPESSTAAPALPMSDMQKPNGKSNTEFAGAGATGSWDKPKPTEATEVYKKSANNVAASDKPNTAPVIISAPTTNNTSNQKQNITMPRSIRNDDSGFNRYVSKNAIFA